nr:hypothetical protein CFP56_38853 [Quercus suber]
MSFPLFRLGNVVGRFERSQLPTSEDTARYEWPTLMLKRFVNVLRGLVTSLIKQCFMPLVPVQLLAQPTSLAGVCAMEDRNVTSSQCK